MPYAPPTITAAGLSIPSYNDILASLLDSYKTIYGQSVYLGMDAADYQWISAVSIKLSDNCNQCQLAYNSAAPQTAIGAALDQLVKLSGIARKPASPSTATVILTGTPNTATVITNGVVGDANGLYWSLPTPFTIPSSPSGQASATATCQTTGPVSAAANTITSIVGGYTAGWLSVTNPNEATPGTGVETDSELRARQAISVALPSSTRLAATIAAIAKLPGVTRYLVLENQTNVTDSYGNGPHSITAVVEGGDPNAIAKAIYDNKGLGCNTQAATATTMTIVPVTDLNTGNVTNIGYIASGIGTPNAIPIYVTMTVHPLPPATTLTTAVITDIQNAVADYLDSLQFGEEVTQSALYGAALSVMPNLSMPTFSIRSVTLGTSPSPTGTVDLLLQFFQVADGVSANVTVTPV